MTHQVISLSGGKDKPISVGDKIKATTAIMYPDCPEYPRFVDFGTIGKVISLTKESHWVGPRYVKEQGYNVRFGIENGGEPFLVFANEIERIAGKDSKDSISVYLARCIMNNLNRAVMDFKNTIQATLWTFCLEDNNKEGRFKVFLDVICSAHEEYLRKNVEENMEAEITKSISKILRKINDATSNN